MICSKEGPSGARWYADREASWGQLPRCIFHYFTSRDGHSDAMEYVHHYCSLRKFTLMIFRSKFFFSALYLNMLLEVSKTSNFTLLHCDSGVQIVSFEEGNRSEFQICPQVIFAISRY